MKYKISIEHKNRGDSKITLVELETIFQHVNRAIEFSSLNIKNYPEVHTSLKVYSTASKMRPRWKIVEIKVLSFRSNPDFST